MNKLIIIGAGGHGKVIADNAVKNGYSDIRFLDDHAVGTCLGFRIVGSSNDIPHFDDGETDFILGIGNNAVRKKISETFDVNWVTLIHPSATIGLDVTVEEGTVIMAGAVVNACSKIGKHCIINSGAVVEHDNVIGDYVHISPRAALGGTVSVGACSHVGIGATVKNNVDICDNCVIGAGAVVVKNICEGGTYVGVPARKIK